MTGKIMIADDQFVVRQVIWMYLENLGLGDEVISCSDGEEVVLYFRNFLDKIGKEVSLKNDHICVQPVSLLMMDINMPIKTGLEAKDEVCQLFDKFNANRE